MHGRQNGNRAMEKRFVGFEIPDPIECVWIDEPNGTAASKIVVFDFDHFIKPVSRGEDMTEPPISVTIGAGKPVRAVQSRLPRPRLRIPTIAGSQTNRWRAADPTDRGQLRGWAVWFMPPLTGGCIVGAEVALVQAS